MACVNGRTKPDLWEKSKKQAIAKMGGRHSARAMQEAGRIYREKGGGYCGTRTQAQKKLSRWTKEDWTTATGKTACRKNPKTGKYTVCDRYLPSKAWERLTPGQKRSTRGKKQRARRQYVPNAPSAKKAGKRARTEPLR
jgi:hypothetical protein